MESSVIPEIIYDGRGFRFCIRIPGKHVVKEPSLYKGFRQVYSMSGIDQK